jgi:8-oxo-dGTP pyrophosphatase MutT (NUDIX family)
MNKKKIVRRARHGKPVDQVAALPYRFSEEGEVEVLLLTSRGTGRFVVPKGWPMKGRRDCDAAAREAPEEAGVEGFLGRSPIGAFSYQK